jgi:hypothetical protein
MTQHLAILVDGVVHDLSDRLLTSPAGAEVDARSSKKLVVVLARSYGTIGYAGESIVDSIPTDEWLARVIRGAGARGRVPERLDVWHVGELAHRLETALNRLVTPSRPPRLAGLLLVSYVGFQRTRRGELRPFAFTFRLDPTVESCSRRSWRDSTRSWQREGFVVATPPLSDADTERFAADRRTAVANGEHLCDAAVAAMRRASQRADVGDRILDLRIDLRAGPHLHADPNVRADPNVEIRLHRPVGAGDHVEVGGGHSVELVPTPWFAAPLITTRPTAMSAWDEWIIGGTPFRIRVFAPEGSTANPGLVSGAMLPTPRKRRPTTSNRQARYGSDIASRQRDYALLANKLETVMRMCGIGRPMHKWAGRAGVAAVVERLPTEPATKNMLVRAVGTLGCRIVLVTPLWQRLFVGNFDDPDEPERVAEAILKEWRMAQMAAARIAEQTVGEQGPTAGENAPRKS